MFYPPTSENLGAIRNSRCSPKYLFLHAFTCFLIILSFQSLRVKKKKTVRMENSIMVKNSSCRGTAVLEFPVPLV
jgi:hypothetical protein